MTPEEFRRHGHAMIDWIADYRTRTGRGEYAVQSQVAPGAVAAQVPAAPPEQGEDFAAMLADLNAVILPGVTHWQHPHFFGYFPAGGALASVLGDFASSGLAAIGLNWQAGPALTEIEERTLDWFRQMVGISAAWRGAIQDTASTATLVALICARERATDYAAAHGGLQAEASALVVYTSRHSHSSVEKAAMLAGFGKDNLRLIAVDNEYAMRADALAAAIAADRAAGRKPCAIVATTGTTGTTALDPLAAIGEIATRQQLWLHVDAALAGSAMILPECRYMWRGVEMADSLVVNPHKWLGTVFDCSLFYVRDSEHLIRVMSSNPSYLRTAHDGEAINYRDWGIPLGRRFRALKLWFHIREQGVNGLRSRLRRDLASAQWLKEQVDRAPNWRRLAPVPLQTVCIRHEPAGLGGDALDRHTLDWCGRINASGFALLTPSQLDGRWMVRVSIGAEPTELGHVTALWNEMQRVAKIE
jgi:aromatic-L-amino-acid decarboxylase